jgi:hypothetical protein
MSLARILNDEPPPARSSNVSVAASTSSSSPSVLSPTYASGGTGTALPGHNDPNAPPQGVHDYTDVRSLPIWEIRRYSVRAC